MENNNGDIETALFVSIERLKDLCRMYWYTRVSGGDDGVSKGVLVPKEAFLELTF